MYMFMYNDRGRMIAWKVLSVCVIMLVIDSAASGIPSNFFGSPEVFSGYLSNQEDFIEAFTLPEDHVTIAGTVHEVEQALATMDTSGKQYKYTCM